MVNIFEAGISQGQARIYQLRAYRLFSLFETVGRSKGNFLNILNLIGIYLMVMVL